MFLISNPTCLGREQGGAALQERDYMGVAANRQHRIAPSHWILSTILRQYIAAPLAGYGICGGIGAQGADPVRHGAFGKNKLNKRKDTER